MDGQEQKNGPSCSSEKNSDDGGNSMRNGIVAIDRSSKPCRVVATFYHSERLLVCDEILSHNIAPKNPRRENGLFLVGCFNIILYSDSRCSGIYAYTELGSQRHQTGKCSARSFYWTMC